MSYGYYRVGSTVDPARARERLASAMMLEASHLAPGHTDLMVAPESIDAFLEAHPLPAESPTEIVPAQMSRKMAEQLGYTGDPCDNCGSMKMQRTGHCNTCRDCGTTTGCS